MKHWVLKFWPYLDDLYNAARERNWPLFWRILAAMLVQVALASGLVVLAGCGQISANYDSGVSATKPANVTIEQFEKSKDTEVVIPK